MKQKKEEIKAKKNIIPPNSIRYILFLFVVSTALLVVFNRSQEFKKEEQNNKTGISKDPLATENDSINNSERIIISNSNTLIFD